MMGLRLNFLFLFKKQCRQHLHNESMSQVAAILIRLTKLDTWLCRKVEGLPECPRKERLQAASISASCFKIYEYFSI